MITCPFLIDDTGSYATVKITSLRHSVIIEVFRACCAIMPA